MKLFIWDLHGTLEEGNERAVIVLSNQVLRRFGYSQRFGEQHIRDLYGLKWYQYFESLLPNVDHQLHLQLQSACFELSNSLDGIKTISRHMRPSLHSLEVLEAIDMRHKQVLISNTVPESIPIFVEALGMDSYFDRTNAFAVDNHSNESRRSKLDVLTEYVKDKTFDDYVVIGDSESDMILAEAIRGKGYLYAHSGLAHRSIKGVPINDLSEILVEV